MTKWVLMILILCIKINSFSQTTYEFSVYDTIGCTGSGCDSETDGNIQITMNMGDTLRFKNGEPVIRAMYLHKNGEWPINDDSYNPGDLIYGNAVNPGNYLDTSIVVSSNSVYKCSFYSPWSFIHFINVKIIISNVGIENSNDFTFNVYPNPTTDYINISGENLTGYSVQVVDISGRCITQTILLQNNTILDLSKSIKGVYFLRLIDGSGKCLSTKKIINQ